MKLNTLINILLLLLIAGIGIYIFRYMERPEKNGPTLLLIGIFVLIALLSSVGSFTAFVHLFKVKDNMQLTASLPNCALFFQMVLFYFYESMIPIATKIRIDLVFLAPFLLLNCIAGLFLFFLGLSLYVIKD